MNNDSKINTLKKKIVETNGYLDNGRYDRELYNQLFHIYLKENRNNVYIGVSSYNNWLENIFEGTNVVLPSKSTLRAWYNEILKDRASMITTYTIYDNSKMKNIHLRAKEAYDICGDYSFFKNRFVLNWCFEEWDTELSKGIDIYELSKTLFFRYYSLGIPLDEIEVFLDYIRERIYSDNTSISNNQSFSEILNPKLFSTGIETP